MKLCQNCPTKSLKYNISKEEKFFLNEKKKIKLEPKLKQRGCLFWIMLPLS